MKQSDGGYAPSYNAQISTDAKQTIIVAAEILGSVTARCGGGAISSTATMGLIGGGVTECRLRQSLPRPFRF